MKKALEKSLERANNVLLAILAAAIFVYLAHFSYEWVRRPHPDLNHGYEKTDIKRLSRLIDRENRAAKYMKENPTVAFDVFAPEVRLIRSDGSVLQ